MATDGQKSEDLGEERLVSSHSENQNQDGHFVLPLWTESLNQNNVQYPSVSNESQKNTTTQFSSSSQNQVHFQQNFTQIRSRESSSHVCPVTYSDTLDTPQNIQDGGSLNMQDGGELILQDRRPLNVQIGEQPNIQDGGTMNMQDGGELILQDRGPLNVQIGEPQNIQDGGPMNMQDGGELILQDRRPLNVQIGEQQNIQDGGPMNMQDTMVLNIQDDGAMNIQDRQLKAADDIQHTFQDSRALNIQNVYTPIQSVDVRDNVNGQFIETSMTAPLISESQNPATFGYSKMLVNSQEQIPLSYTELLSSVQNTPENSKIISQTSAAGLSQVMGVSHSETGSHLTETDIGISSQVEKTSYSQNGENQTKDKDPNKTQKDFESKKADELAEALPEIESRNTAVEVVGPSMNLIGLFDSKNSNPDTVNSDLTETPVDVQQGLSENEEMIVRVKQIQINPEQVKEPVQKKSLKSKRTEGGQTLKGAKRKLRPNNKIEMNETTRVGTLRSGKKTKRCRKKADTPVEYEIVKHEKNISGETIEIEAYNDLLTELNSMKDEYIKLQNVLTDVESKYNALLLTTSDINTKKEEDPELFSNKLLSTVASYFNKPLFSDIQVLLGENQIIHAHKLILSTRSEYWGLQHLYYIDKLDLTGVRQEVGYELMKWVYTDDLDTKVDVSFMIEILHASVKYKLDGLYKRCEKGLISLININNCENLKDVAEDLNCTELIEECQQFLDVHQIAPVSPLKEEVLDDLDNEEDSDFEPSVIFEEKKKRGIKRLKGLKDKKRLTIRNKKKISSIVEKLHHKKLSEAVDVELGGKLSKRNRLERIEMKARILAGEKPYQCEQCGRAFAAKGNLKRHISMHSDDKPFECGICRKGFKTNSEVKRHNIVHSGEKRFMCDICSMCFSAGSSLHRHMRIHRGEKPYQCEACGKSFRSSGDVTKHNLTHTGEKPYKCPVCSKPFSRTQHVKKHMGIHKRQLGLQFHENQYPDYVRVTSND